MLRTNDFPGISRWSNGRRRQLNKRLLSGRQLLSSLFCILKKDSYFRGGGYFRVYFASWKKAVTFGEAVTFEFILHLGKRRLLSGRRLLSSLFCINWKKVVTFGEAVTFEFILHLEKRQLLSGRRLYFRVYFASWKKEVTFRGSGFFRCILHIYHILLCMYFVTLCRENIWTN